MLKNLTTLMIYVSDMDKALGFYRDVMGLPVEMQSPGWSQLSLSGGVSLGLHQAAQPRRQGGGAIPIFDVDDIRGFRSRLEIASVKLEGDYHDIPGGVSLSFYDPEGNAIHVTQSGISCADLGVVNSQASASS